MPLTEVSNRVEAPENKGFVTLPEDVYQVVIKDIDEKIMTKYKSAEEDAFYQFKLAVLDEGENIQGETINIFTSRKWFSGNKKAQPSKLVTLVKAVYAFYHPKLDVIELEADDMTLQVINDLIGKQMRVTIKVNEEKTGNKVTEFMAVKREIEIPSGIEIAKVSKKMAVRESAPTNSKHAEVKDDPEEKPRKEKEPLDDYPDDQRPLPWEK